jgi:hypothetical protein
MIASRESVRAAVQRAMALHPDEAAAVAAVAQALALPAETVREAIAEEAESA